MTLQECQGSSCQTIETSVDTSVLVPSHADQSTDVATPSTISPSTEMTTSTSVPTTSGESSVSSASSSAENGLSAECILYSDPIRIWCQASGYSDSAWVTWSEDGGLGGAQGANFELPLSDQQLLEPATRISVKDCGSTAESDIAEGACVTVQVTVDTSSVALSPARIEYLSCADDGVTLGRPMTCSAQVGGDVNYVKWSHRIGDTIWNAIDDADTSLQEALIHQVTFQDQAGDHEVALTVCTLTSLESETCTEDAVQAQVEPMTTRDLVRSRHSGTPTDCEGEGSQNLAISPIALEQLDWIHPLGAVNGGHPAPVSHQYWVPRADIVADIRAPADGFIISLYNRDPNKEEAVGNATGEDYEVAYTIEVSCDFYLGLDHVIGVPESIRAVLGEQISVNQRIAVSAGDLLGQHHSGYKIDVSIVDLTLEEVDGFVRKDSYYNGQEGEVFKLFERDALEYFDEPLRSSLTDKSLRTLEPRGGFFVYDVDGTAQGTWFQQGSGGFSGWGDPEVRNNQSAYSGKGKLSLKPDNLEPFRLRVGMGDGFQDDVNAHIWGVTGDEPAFNTVTVASGPTTYGIWRLLPCDGSSETVRSRGRNFECNATELGTLLIELTDDRTMRVEVFFNVSPISGPTFTDSARTYLR